MPCSRPTSRSGGSTRGDSDQRRSCCSDGRRRAGQGRSEPGRDASRGRCRPPTPARGAGRRPRSGGRARARARGSARRAGRRRIRHRRVDGAGAGGACVQAGARARRDTAPSSSRTTRSGAPMPSSPRGSSLTRSGRSRTISCSRESSRPTVPRERFRQRSRSSSTFPPSHSRDGVEITGDRLVAERQTSAGYDVVACDSSGARDADRSRRRGAPSLGARHDGRPQEADPDGLARRARRRSPRRLRRRIE